MANKRKRDESSDSDSDEVTPGKQILPVANLPYDFDQEPLDGMQYLFLVRRDARRLPRVTRVPNPYEKLEPNVQLTSTPSSTDVLPCEEWRIAFQTHFYNLRKNLTQTTHANPDHPSSKQRIIPEKKDRDAWWKFLTGHPESAWRPKERSTRKKPAGGMRAFAHSATAVFSVDVENLPEQAGDGSSQFPTACLVDVSGNDLRQSDFVPQRVEAMHATQVEIMASLEKGEDHVEQLLPPQVTPSYLREIDHRMSIHLLMYFAHWMNIHLQHPSDPLTAILVSHGQWIFALLTKVEDQLSADEMNLMRNLARACLGLVQRHKHEHAQSDAVARVEDTRHMSDASCWIIFTAIAGYWGQRDLWADAEAMLTSA